MSYSIDQLDYVQRVAASKPTGGSIDLARAWPAQERELWRIRRVGRSDRATPIRQDGRMRLPSEDALVGLYGSRIPIAYFVYGQAGRVSLEVGTWAPRSTGPAEALKQKQQILKTALGSLYPALDLEPVGAVELAVAPRAGLVIGMPTAKPPDLSDEVLPLDRLIRAMADLNWAFLLLALPAPEKLISQQRSQIVEELRLVESGVQTAGAASPLADHYGQVLKVALHRLTSGLAVGAWHTALYLLGDEQSYHRLASVWAGVFSGEESLPEPVQVLNHPSAAQLASNWAMPRESGAPGPGRYQHPFQFQTLLTSTQLAAYVHFPQLEWNGFSVQTVPAFDTVPVKSPRPSIRLGKVIPRQRSIPLERPDDRKEAEWAREQYNSLPETFYEFGLKALTKHVFVAGVTGAGKTRTIFQILKSAFASSPRVPFLVIEPAKTEYRELLRHEEISDKLQVFTLGNETISPFRLNPFEMSEGTSVGMHIAMLRSVFSASFGWWNPLPQVFEKCAHLIYQDRGWDVASDFNRRNKNRDKTDFRVFPTLSDLLAKADEVVPTLGYDAEAKGRVQGHFRATLLGLRTGAKGRMLDVEQSLPISILLENPTVLELEGLGDDDDKAFMMGLLLIRLVEYRRSPEDKAKAEEIKGLRHLLVFEEAHRLLANVAARSEEGAANPRAKAVECFANLLAEIRKYGQGVIVTDQVPTKLAPDVIKNTNLKIAHRIVDEPDRKVLAGSMVMTEGQALAISTLLPGRAAVFAEGDDSPLLVHIAPGDEMAPPNDDALRASMANSPVLAPHRDIFLPHVGCTDVGVNSGAMCEIARGIVETPAFQRDVVRLVMSSLDDQSSPERLWPFIAAHIQAAQAGVLGDSTTGDGSPDVLMRCVISRAAQWYAARQGAQTAQSYKLVAELSEALEAVFLSQWNKSDRGKTDHVLKLVDCLKRMHKQNFLPYSHCDKICGKKDSVCLYRHAVADLVSKGEFPKRWRDSKPFDASNKTDSWHICEWVAEQFVEWKIAQELASWRIGLCFAQMMLVNEATHVPKRCNEVFEQLCQQAESSGAPVSVAPQPQAQ